MFGLSVPCVAGLFESEYEIDRSNQEHAGYEMIPLQRHVKRYGGEDYKDHQCDHFLNHFELHQGERASVPLKSYAVCGHLETVFEESDAPREEDDKNQRCGVREEARLLQFEMAVPCQGHEDIGGQQ